MLVCTCLDIWLLCVALQNEVKEARDMMVEANTQEYAFNFFQQSLKNKIQDAEVIDSFKGTFCFAPIWT